MPEDPLPTGWETMASTALPVTDYTVNIAVGSLTGTFTYRVRRQPASTRTIASLSTTFERFTLTFIVTDVTDYTATTNLMTVLGTSFTTAAIMALRNLISGGLTMIPKPGALIAFGGANSIVDTVDIAQMADKTTDVFLVTCNIKEIPTSSAYVASENSPRLNKSDDVPPWQMGTKAVFDTSESEGLTLGFAYPTDDLDGKKKYSASDLLTKGYAKDDATMAAVENYANDPFSSPPSLKTVVGSIILTRAFLREQLGNKPIDVFSLKAGKVNDEDIKIHVAGAVFAFPKGTISPSSICVSPEVYKMQIPWFNKTKHPLDKTYGELFYGYSGRAANNVAFNSTGQTIMVTKPLQYLDVKVSIAYRQNGFGVWIANRGYTELDSNDPTGRAVITDKKTNSVKEAWLTKAGKKTKDERIYRGFTTCQGSPWVTELLTYFFPKIEEIPWATTRNKYGNLVITT